LTAALIENPAEADVARANAAITLVSNRLAEAQADVAELRRSVGETAFLAEVDPALRSELLAVRARLAAAEARVAELTAAEVVGRDLAAEAKRRALEARQGEDWQAAAGLLEEAASTVRALNAMAGQMGELYRRLKAELDTATGHVTRHMARQEHALLIQPPNLDDTLRLVLSNAGGPPVDPMRMLTVAPSLTEAVAHHAAMVLRHRPATTPAPEDSHHE
jgi:hypothetical protein